MGRSTSSTPRGIKYRMDLWEIVNRLWDAGYTYNQIADQLGITVAQVKAKVRGRLRNTEPQCG